MSRTALVGNPNAVLKAQEPSYSQEHGLTYREVWTGTKAAVTAKLAYYITLGFNGSVSKMTAGSWQLVINVPDVVFDRWELDTEWEQDSIFSSPEVDAEMSQFTSPANYRKTIRDAVNNGDDTLSNGLGPYPIANRLFRLLSRGVEGYERRRPVLRRKRAIPAQWASPIILETKEAVYTTGSLIAGFNVPASVAVQLPGDPALTPTDCVWAWKTRVQSSETIPARNRTEEQYEWVFAAWPTLFYNVV